MVRADPADAGAHAQILPGLQLLRGLAALGVAFTHVSNQAGVLLGRYVGPDYAWPRIFPFDSGVDIFFVISGFVMVRSSHPLFGREGARLVFAGRRLARVVPLYWVATTLLLLTALVLPGALNDARPSAALVAASYLFLPWRRPDGLIQPVFNLGWTLNYEMFFYAIFAIFIGFRARVAVPCVIGIVCVLVGLGWLTEPQTTMLEFWSDPIMLEFAAGAVLAIPGRAVQLAGPVRAILAMAGLIGLWAADRSGWPHALSYIPPCVALVAAAALARPAPIPSPATQAAIKFGDMSYALYLSHPFPMRALTLATVRTGLAASVGGVIGFVVAALAASLVLAWVVHLWVERPLTRAARRLWPTERALAF